MPTDSVTTRRAILLLAACLCGLGAGAMGGCSWYDRPRLAVTEVELADETEDGLVLRFGIEATNENEVPLPLREVTYALILDGERVFEGRRSAEATLRREGAQRLTLPVAIRLGEGGYTRPEGVIPYTLKGRLTYVTPGQVAELLFDTGVRVPTVRFRERGRIDFGPQNEG